MSTLPILLVINTMDVHWQRPGYACHIQKKNVSETQQSIFEVDLMMYEGT